MTDRSYRSPQPVLIVGLVIAALLVVFGLRSHHSNPPGSSPSRPTATADAGPSAQTLATAFLSSWVEADGRVVRRDQGGDTVSEGQAYGMLLAVATGQSATFDLIWGWTRAHLQQSDSLLAWRWSDGRVVDAQSAGDADIDAAWALLLAAQKFHDPSLANQAASITAAALALETVPTVSGRVLVAGPWATRTEMANPSYLVPGMADLLARQTGQSGWTAVAAGTRAMDRELVGTTTLPPDWAAVAGATAVAAGSPDHSAGPQYGLDAPRLFVRLAASCDATDRALAGSAAAAVGPAGKPGIRSLSGQDQVSWRHPLTDVALAAVRSAGGDQAGAQAALSSAEQAQTASPTYYGAAWVALGSVLLTTNLLTQCGAASTS